MDLYEKISISKLKDENFRTFTFFLRSAFFSLPIHGIGKLGSEGLEKKTHRRNRRKLFADCILILKFIYSEKAAKFCEIFTLLLTVCTAVKNKVKISQKFCGPLILYDL